MHSMREHRCEQRGIVPWHVDRTIPQIPTLRIAQILARENRKQRPDLARIDTIGRCRIVGSAQVPVQRTRQIGADAFSHMRVCHDTPIDFQKVGLPGVAVNDVLHVEKTVDAERTRQRFRTIARLPRFDEADNRGLTSDLFG